MKTKNAPTLLNSFYKLDPADVCLKSMALCYGSILLVNMLFYMYHDCFPLVLSSSLGLCACLVAFLLTGRVQSAAVALFNCAIAAHCFFSVYFLGWGANTQWILPPAHLCCYLVLPLTLYARVAYSGLFMGTMLACISMFGRAAVVPASINLRAAAFLALVSGCLICGFVMFLDIVNSKTVRKSYKTHIDRLTEDANTDPLTKLWSRRYATEQIRKLISDAETGGFAVALFDVDHFKAVNDTYGHQFGDLVLKKISETVLRNFRKYDIAARWGGEEFLIVLPNTGSCEIFPFMEKLRVAIQNTAVTDGEQSANVTVTIGLSEYREGCAIEDVIRECDIALYQGKSRNRNQTVVYSDVNKAGIAG